MTKSPLVADLIKHAQSKVQTALDDVTSLLDSPDEKIAVMSGAMGLMIGLTAVLIIQSCHEKSGETPPVDVVMEGVKKVLLQATAGVTAQVQEKMARAGR